MSEITEFPRVASETSSLPTIAAPALPVTSVEPHQTSPETEVDAELAQHRSTSAWLVVTRPSDGERQIHDKQAFLPAIGNCIVAGTLRADDAIEIHVQDASGTWSQTTRSVADFAKSNFELRVLFEPVWSHAIAGLKWGALIGIGLKLIDTFVALSSVNPGIALLFLVTVGVCLIPRIGMAGVIFVSLATARFSHANFFVMGGAAALTGATLGCLPGMAIGGVVGLARRSALPRAASTAHESGDVVAKAIVVPLCGAAALLSFYFFVAIPWMTEFLNRPQ